MPEAAGAISPMHIIKCAATVKHVLATPTSAAIKPKKINLRTPDVMARVQEQVESHYRSVIVERLRASGGVLTVRDTTIRLAKQFGFCYGVERAIDLAYAARKVFQGRRLFIFGEIIHNPLVNEQIAAMGIKNLTRNKQKEAEIEDLTADDIVIVPAFGTDLKTLAFIQDRGCQTVHTTCGDVMSIWKRVRQNALRERHLDHSWQGRTRGNEGNCLARTRPVEEDATS